MNIHCLLKMSLSGIFSTFVLCLLAACVGQPSSQNSISLSVKAPQKITVEVTEHLTQRLTFQLDNPGNYANLSVLIAGKPVIDSLNLPHSGEHSVDALVKFEHLGINEIAVLAHHSDLTLKTLHLTPVDAVVMPHYEDISEQAGLDKVNSIKYGGPTIADFDNDGDYDFVVNNHNIETSKLYWNQGDGTVKRHHKDLARWFMNDLHGTAAGDYDNDGDLDLVVTQGGGVGRNPSTANFYKNEGGELVLMTGDVGITRGGRGRGAKWADMDLDGDLDLLLYNETSLHGDKPQHFFYENQGDGTFKFKSVEGIQDVHPSRVLMTDLNNDNIDDFIFYSPLSVWLGNGDFTYTKITQQFPAKVQNAKTTIAIADIDIDNDGDLDLYLANGQSYESSVNSSPMFDFDALNQQVSIRTKGKPGHDEFEFSAPGAIKWQDYDYSVRTIQRDKPYPIFLGKTKNRQAIKKGEELSITPKQANGWPNEFSENGVYLGYVGDGQWRARLVRDKHLFWSYTFTLSGVDHAVAQFDPLNRNVSDVLLRNDNGKFVEVSEQWNLPKGANSMGGTVADFNNDGHSDLLVYRWGNINGTVSEYMLLNTGKGRFENTTMHGASYSGAPGNGDMGQAFDFDLDGKIDILSGNESGQWYLYKNKTANGGNYAEVRVGYSPKDNVDPISASVTVQTKTQTYRQRVGSAGAVFSQSLLNIVHFGLGEADTIQSIKIRWRNGETVEFLNKEVNQRFDTDKLDPVSLALNPQAFDIRTATQRSLTAQFNPTHSDQRLIWRSSQPNILTVDASGQVTAVGKVGQSAQITATSKANQLVATAVGKIVPWQAIKAESINLSVPKNQLYVGESMVLRGQLVPEYADGSLQWHSQNPNVVSITQQGQVKALAEGKSQIDVWVKETPNVRHSATISVKERSEPYIKIIDQSRYENGQFKVGQKIRVKAAFHAGADNQVILADQGGLRFWLRHFKSEWFPEKDVILTDTQVVGKTSGVSEMEISFEGLVPTADLPAGHFYLLGVSFASSNGKIYNQTIYPLNIVAD